MSAATPVMSRVPTMAGAMPPPANWVTIGRFLVRKLRLITPAPRLATYTAITATGTSANSSDAIIHEVASPFASRRRGETARATSQAPESLADDGGAGGEATVIARPLTEPQYGSRQNVRPHLRRS